MNVKNEQNKTPKKKSPRPKLLHKIIRTRLVDGMLCNMRSTGLPDKLSGFLLKSLHFHTPWYFLILFLLLPIKFATIALIPLLASLALFLYLRGCFLSIVEYKLSHDDTNIIDPYIAFCDQEINDENRYKYTLGVSGLYFIVVGIILTVRYIYRNDNDTEFIKIIINP